LPLSGLKQKRTFELAPAFSARTTVGISHSMIGGANHRRQTITWKGSWAWDKLLFYKPIGRVVEGARTVITKRSDLCNIDDLCLIAVI